MRISFSEENNRNSEENWSGAVANIVDFLLNFIPEE
jgi:hypothetical protein